jgi:Domain of unknown function (DUF4476)
MKKFIYTFYLSLFFSLNLTAQQNHFVYIQADNKQPFYVKLNDKVYSSSATGYIILSKLVENNYNLTIGFPKNEWAEQKLNLIVQKNDLGYLLKNFDEKGWGLVDMNTFQILYGNTQPATTKPSNAVAKANEVKEKLVVAKQEESKKPAENKIQLRNVVKVPKEAKKEEPITAEIKGQEKGIVKIEEIKEQSKPIEKVETEIKAAITKLFTSKSNNNIEIVYVVKNNTIFDTVRVSIPIDEYKTQVNPEVQSVKTTETKINNEVIPAPVPPVAKPIENHIEKPIEKPVEEQPKKTANTNPPKENNVIKSIPKNNCVSLANEEDYKKLRKKMASSESDNEMLFRAYTAFQKQCYTTEQIKTLSFLFLNDDGKYKFFDTAYPCVTDIENFPKLASVLSDEYYVKRFNAMLKN